MLCADILMHKVERMSNSEISSLQNYADAMKRDWNDRAREDSRWYINTIKRNQNDEEFDATGKPEVENFILAEPLITAGRDLKTARLLEIGCGIGRMTRHLAGIFAEIHGTDVSAEMIEQARLRFADAPNVSFHETNGLDFAALPDRYFDVIFSVYVFQHVPSPEVVRSNIRDACRVLAPGGVFKFQVCGIDHPDYESMPKDTWTGTPFPESALRQAAKENHVRCLSIQGLGTQYAWAVFQKPGGETAPATETSLQILSCGRADDPAIKTIPTNGDFASLSLVVSGISPVEDVNSLWIEIGGQEFSPHYLGPSSSDQTNFQIRLFTSPAIRPGSQRIRVRDSKGRRSNEALIEILPPQALAPRIHMINNAVDGGIDIDASGPKAVFRVFADRMDSDANPENVRVLVNEMSLKPASVSFLPANGFYLSIVKLPESMAAQEAEVRIQCKGLASEPARIRIIG